MTDKQKTQIISARKKGVGYASIAKDVGMSKNAVAAFCRRHDLTGDMSDKSTNSSESSLCRECGKPLNQVDGMKTRVFCSHQCKSRWWREHPEKLNRKAMYLHQAFFLLGKYVAAFFQTTLLCFHCGYLGTEIEDQFCKIFEDGFLFHLQRMNLCEQFICISEDFPGLLVKLDGIRKPKDFRIDFI